MVWCTGFLFSARVPSHSLLQKGVETLTCGCINCILASYMIFLLSLDWKSACLIVLVLFPFLLIFIFGSRLSDFIFVLEDDSP